MVLLLCSNSHPTRREKKIATKLFSIYRYFLISIYLYIYFFISSRMLNEVCVCMCMCFGFSRFLIPFNIFASLELKDRKFISLIFTTFPFSARAQLLLFILNILFKFDTIRKWKWVEITYLQRCLLLF